MIRNVKEALLRSLDDLEDIYIAEQRLEDIKAGKTKLKTLDEIKKELDL